MLLIRHGIYLERDFYQLFGQYHHIFIIFKKKNVMIIQQILIMELKLIHHGKNSGFQAKFRSFYFKLFTDYPILIFPKKLTCFKEIFIGLCKSYFKTPLEGCNFNRKRFIYDNLGIRGFRDYVITKMNTKDVSTPNPSQPIVLIIQRTGNVGCILNFDKLVN